MTTSSELIRVSLHEAAVAALKARKVSTGLWRIAAGMRFAAITADYLENATGVTEFLPTAMVGITDIALIPVDSAGPLVLDASTMQMLPWPEAVPTVNPAKATAKPRVSHSKAAPRKKPARSSE